RRQRMDGRHHSSPCLRTEPTADSVHSPLEGEGRFASREARCETGWGDSLSSQTVPVWRDHPTPSHISLRSCDIAEASLRRLFERPPGRAAYAPLQGRVKDSL